MPDISAIPNLSDVLKEYGFKTGAIIESRFANMDADRQQKLDAAIATLTGTDTAVMAVIEKLQRITDPVPGTPEHEEGQNLYQLMETNYLALDDRLTANEDLASSLQTWRDGFVTNYNTTIERIDAAILLETQTRQSEVTRLEGLINAANEAVGAANAARAAMKIALENTDASQTDEINAIKLRLNTAEQTVATHTENVSTLQTQMNTRIQEISALQTKQQELEGRVVALENKFVGYNADDAVAAFAEGIGGQPSSDGYANPTA